MSAERALQREKAGIECVIMRDAYIILCHRSPWQVNELAAYLAEGGNDVYIHMDKSGDIQGQLIETEHIHVVSSPVKVSWADWSIVKATLLLVNSLRGKGREYRYVHLLSGQCLPAMPRNEMNRELEKAYAEGCQFMECKQLPRSDKWGRDGGIHRVGAWFPRRLVSKYSPWHRWFWPYTNKWIRLRLRRPLYFMFRPFYGGAQWWSLTGDCVADIADYAAKHFLFRYFFHHAFCSDELFFQTCISRTSHHSGVTGDNRRFLKWEKPDAQSPMDLTEPLWPELWASGAFFGRKFSMQPGETTSYLRKLEESL